MSIVAKKITRDFGQPPTRILHGIDLEIRSGEFISISGRSGSGKSTLLYIMSTLDRPTAGELLIDGRDVYKMGTAELHEFRSRNIGFVFQFHYLVPELTVLENVLLAPMNLGLEKTKAAFGRELLERCGLPGKETRFPSSLSGGEQQRVALARALVMKPRYIFADEPTGNLDSVNGEKVMGLLREASRENGATVVMVTHDPDFAAMADREIRLVDGRMQSPLSVNGAL